MKVVILRAVSCESDASADEDYLQAFDTLYAERVIGNLRGYKGFCSSCVDDCVFCRESYGRCYSDDIAVVDFPAVLPYILENPHEYLPDGVPVHDVILAINIHEQILLEVVKACGDWGTKGVIVPLEEPGIVSGSARVEAEKICDASGIEISFPKPFCAFNPSKRGVLYEFREHFKIGYPDVKLTVEGGIIKKADVNMSAACGATYYVARWLEGRSLEDNLEIEVVAKRMSSYPCTASMERDPELQDDTIMHIAGQAHYAILNQVKRPERFDNDMIMSPAGVMIHRPVPARENLDNIENAKQEILDVLEDQPSIALEQLKKLTTSTPAATSSALLLLKQEGIITITKGTISKV